MDETTGAKVDAIELLTSQHREVEQLWSQVQAAHGRDHDLEQELGERIIELLSRHDAVETQVLYPALRELGTDGDQLADHSLAEHKEVRELLATADGRDLCDDEAFTAMQRCIELVESHVEEEETVLFPMLRRLGQERVDDLGEVMQAAWAVAPTRPHPHAPQSPAANAVAGAVAGVMDRIRDAVRNAT